MDTIRNSFTAVSSSIFFFASFEAALVVTDDGDLLGVHVEVEGASATLTTGCVTVLLVFTVATGIVIVTVDVVKAVLLATVVTTCVVTYKIITSRTNKS